MVLPLSKSLLSGNVYMCLMVLYNDFSWTSVSRTSSVLKLIHIFHEHRIISGDWWLMSWLFRTFKILGFLFEPFKLYLHLLIFMLFPGWSMCDYTDRVRVLLSTDSHKFQLWVTVFGSICMYYVIMLFNKTNISLGSDTMHYKSVNNMTSRIMCALITAILW